MKKKDLIKTMLLSAVMLSAPYMKISKLPEKEASNTCVLQNMSTPPYLVHQLLLISKVCMLYPRR